MCFELKNIDIKIWPYLAWHGPDIRQNSQVEWRHDIKWASLSIHNGQESMCRSTACDFHFSVTYRDPFAYLCSRPVCIIHKCMRFNYVRWSSFNHCVLQHSLIANTNDCMQAWDGRRSDYNIGICIGTYLCQSSVSIFSNRFCIAKCLNSQINIFEKYNTCRLHILLPHPCTRI